MYVLVCCGMVVVSLHSAGMTPLRMLSKTEAEVCNNWLTLYIYIGTPTLYLLLLVYLVYISTNGTIGLLVITY